MVYFFSGSLTKEMMRLLSEVPNYKPIDVLVSQLDRSAIRDMIKYQEAGLIGQLFIDSGAFSVHTGKATVDLEEYISYVNGIDKHVHIVAQLDTIPGTFGQPKSDEDYKHSAEASWENFLYMYKRMNSPQKLIPVFHYGESFDTLRTMLEWKDEDGTPLQFIGVSPANDTAQNTKNVYMRDVFRTISESSNPHCKAHLFGMTSLPALAKFPTYSADSISHRKISGYNKILHPKYGVISLSQRARTSRSKSAMSFVDTADDIAIEEVEKYIADLGMTLEYCLESSAARTVVTMCSIQKILQDNPYKPQNTLKIRSLVQLPE